jgi:hypothetical protein
MSEANVRTIRRHYEREAEAFRGGDVHAFLEEFGYDQGIVEAGEEEGALVEGGWRGHDGVTAFLEIAGPVCPSERPRPTGTDESLATWLGCIAGLNHLLAALDRAQLAAFKAFASGGSELLAYFDEPTTNGYAEG